MNGWLHDPWIWLGAGLVLLLAELVVPGYVMLSFALGAFAMALGLLGWAAALGPVPGGVLAALLVWMLLSGLAALAIWRLRSGRREGGEEEDVNDFRNRM